MRLDLIARSHVAFQVRLQFKSLSANLRVGHDHGAGELIIGLVGEPVFHVTPLVGRVELGVAELLLTVLTHQRDSVGMIIPFMSDHVVLRDELFAAMVAIVEYPSFGCSGVLLDVSMHVVSGRSNLRSADQAAFVSVRVELFAMSLQSLETIKYHPLLLVLLLVVRVRASDSDAEILGMLFDVRGELIFSFVVTVHVR